MVESWKIDVIRVSVIKDVKRSGEGASTLQQHRGSEITPELVDNIIKLVVNKQVSRIEVKNTVDCIGLTIFIDDEKSQIGIVDEDNDMIYYYNNETNDNTPINISGYSFDSWMVCNQPSIMLSILNEFIKTGKRLDTVSWVSEAI